MQPIELQAPSETVEVNSQISANHMWEKPLSGQTRKALLDPLIRKLSQLGTLVEEERQLLESMSPTVRRVPTNRDILKEGENRTACTFLLKGIACRYKIVGTMRRQIVSFHVPGDPLDLDGMLLKRMDHNIKSLTPVKVAVVPHETLLDWKRYYPNIGDLFWRDTLIDASIFREWVANVGCRSDMERVAHLLCELATRFRAAGLARANACDMPLTYPELADATGLSVLLLRRTLDRLRRARLIRLQYKTLEVLDWNGLKQAAGFNPAYLHQLAA